ncbi:MAG: molybdopterin-dependent oxidoreductase [Acidobacteriota bacterium]
MKRREFIILSSVGASAAGVFSACGHPEEKLIPALIPDEEYIPGIDVWKASTCAMCDAGCGILVRTRDHKANKIEGNPNHPVNRGALCARGQAGLQVLYNPDRIKAPMKRAGERGAGQFEEITWDEAIKTLGDKLRELSAGGKANAAHFFTTDQRGITAHVASRLMNAYGSQAYLVKPLFSEEQSLGGYSDSFPGVNKPVFDIANATFLLSFGARFLENWHSPLMYARAYGEFRRASGKARGKFVQVEPRMSLTGANADEWLPAKTSSEALVALAIAQVIIREGLAKHAPDAAFVKSLENYAPEKTAVLTDIPAEKIIQVAREFAKAEKPLALTSNAVAMTNGLPGQVWGNFLNTLVGNINQKGGVLLSNRDYNFPLKKLNPVDRFPDVRYGNIPMILADRPIEVLMIHQFNPVYVLPATKEKLKAIPFIASFSSFFDETTELADLLLPDHTFLESWDLTTSDITSDFIVNLTKPVVQPEFNTRQTADVLIAISRLLGDKVASSIPITSAEEIVKQDFTAFANNGAPPVPKQKASEAEESEDEEAEEEEDTWTPLSEKGFLISQVKNQTTSEPQRTAPAKTLDDSLLTVAKENSEYSLTFLPYEHPTHGSGEQANLPVLQELPDALTSVMWGSWVEINPKTAAQLGIKDGDLIEVSSQNGAVRAPVVLYPAIRPDVIAMPLGQGHTSFGRYAKNIGTNLFELPIADWVEDSKPIRVKVTKISSDGKLIRFGTGLPEHIESKR